MGISLKTHKMLWGRSGSRCSMPSCRISLVEDETETDDPSLIGDEAHIIAREENGPRGKSDLSTEERDKYSNLILMCKNHHKLIDDQPETHTVDCLKKMKENHIKWVNENLDIDKSKQKYDEIYAGYIDTWEELAGTDNWDGWSSFVLGGGQPHLYVKKHEKLEKLNNYILGRVWPGRYPELENGFSNFRFVLNDFLNVFMKYAEKYGDDENAMYWTEKFYHIPEYNPDLYNKLSNKFDFHVKLVSDLMLELTRAGNLLCANVRKYISSSFKIKEGVLLVVSGPNMDFSWDTIRVEYKKEQMYPGLVKFMKIRVERDLNIGSGESKDYLPYN